MLTLQNLIPQVRVARVRATSSSVMQQQMTLSQAIVPAVQGEYYSYASVFTNERPLYVLMKCKSNKARLISEASNLRSEVNALFLLDRENPRVLSGKEANLRGLLGDTSLRNVFGDTWFAPTSLSVEQFMELRAGKNPAELARVCQESLMDREVLTGLCEGLVVALMADVGKYGMFLVEEITSSTILVEACHTLL
jgi:hypothetical protein